MSGKGLGTRYRLALYVNGDCFQIHNVFEFENDATYSEILDKIKIGDEVEIESVNGRHETGTLIELEPYYTHDYGVCVPELLAIDKQVREILFGGDK